MTNENHTILGGKVHLYRRNGGEKWHCYVSDAPRPFGFSLPLPASSVSDAPRPFGFSLPLPASSTRA
jgi:hypothetical protein